jgi:DNA-binding PadR family transcriptional regulator
MHGYELILALEERFGGTYVPSAGTIYPRLAKLEEDGLVTKTADGRKTVYAITDAGRAELDARQGELDGIENGVTDSVRRLADEVRTSVNSAMKTLRADLASAARDARVEAKDAGRTVRTDATTPQGDSRTQLQDADVLINEFRQQLRTELRITAARTQLTPENVAVLRQGLEEIRARVTASLDQR